MQRFVSKLGPAASDPQPPQEHRAPLTRPILPLQETMQGAKLPRRQVPKLESARLVSVQVAIFQEVEPTGLVQVHLSRQPKRR
jgi:hypothetical protein